MVSDGGGSVRGLGGDGRSGAVWVSESRAKEAYSGRCVCPLVV